MSILKVARMGHPVLRAKARTVDKSELKNAELQAFIDSMIDTMHEYSGVGLAAPQVHESRRIFVAMLDADGRGEGDAVAFINPEITKIGDQVAEGWEGCLSIPEIRGRVVIGKFTEKLVAFLQSQVVGAEVRGSERGEAPPVVRDRQQVEHARRGSGHPGRDGSLPEDRIWPAFGRDRLDRGELPHPQRQAAEARG